MKISIFFFIITIIGICSSCRDDFKSIPSSGNLEFSRDTVYLDTVFTAIGSATYTLKVYNRSNRDIAIPTIRLNRGEASNYRLNVDGSAGKEFDNVPILAKDSLFIFIETTIAIETVASEETQFLYTDNIAFDSGSNLQQVALVTLVQDAVFLYPKSLGDGTTETLPLGMDNQGNEIKIEGFFIDDEQLTFTDEKPYVIYGYAAVSSGKTLVMEAGTRVHFHDNSGIIIANGGTLIVNGAVSMDPHALENEVIFEGDRLEPAFSDIPGQWGTLWLTEGSTAHQLNYLTIKNATVGILIDSNDGTGTPTLTIKNTQIYNSATIGLWGKTAHIEAENLVIGNSGQSSLYCNIGGRYTFKHCTFANYWNNSFRSFPAVFLDNYITLEEGSVFSQPLVNADFFNCIIYGNNPIEVLFDPVDETSFTYHFKNCLIQFDDFGNQFQDHPLYDFGNSTIYENNLLNMNPDFIDPFRNNYRIGENTTVIAQGHLSTAMEVPFDILGVDRTSNPDIGAYQHLIFEEK